MGFLTDCTRARLVFTRDIKAMGLDAKALDISAEYCEEDEHVFVFAEDSDGTTQAAIGFPLKPEAWNDNLGRELVKLFRGSAILKTRGR